MHTAFQAYIQEYQPRTLLECSNEPCLELAELTRQRHLPFASVNPAQVPDGVQEPADLAIVHHALETMTTESGRQLLGNLRNSLAQRIWLILPKGTDWTLPALVAMGFKMDQPAWFEGNLVSYTYDLGSYNHKREWNNSRFWANPENFNKYRW